jgi:hypothetical protein
VCTASWLTLEEARADYEVAVGEAKALAKVRSQMVVGGRS